MNFLKGKWNSTIRVRLTVLYAGAFFIAGLVLIGVMYYQVNQVVARPFILSKSIAGGESEGGVTQTTTVRIQRSPTGVDDAGDLAASLPGLAPTHEPGLPIPDLLAQVEAQMNVVRAETLKNIVTVSAFSLLALGAIATLLGYLLAGQALQPLRQITATARGIADRNLHQRIAMEGPDDEIKDLANTLDNMLERLDRAFDSQQRFIANASHELRTPLAINRTLIEVAVMKEPTPDSALAQLGATLLAVNQRHERLIDGLLMLASSDQEIADAQLIELSEVAQHVLLESSAMARSAGVELRSQLSAAPCSGDPVLLERLIRNLTDNAIRYNIAEAGWIAVNTGTDAQGRAMLTVENPGPLIPLYEVPRLFEPFRRLRSMERLADSSGSLGRRGAGLGLSIVRSIATSHGAKVDALARREGGLWITITFPAKPLPVS